METVNMDAELEEEEDSSPEESVPIISAGPATLRLRVSEAQYL